MRAARSCRVITSRFSAISQFIHQPSCIRYYVHRTSARLQTTRALLQKPDSFSRWSSEAFARHSFAGYPARFYTAKPSSFESPSTQEASGRDIVLSPPALVVTREFEWANILVGFEQANKYTIRAAPGGNVVGYLAEVSPKSFFSSVYIFLLCLVFTHFLSVLHRSLFCSIGGLTWQVNYEECTTNTSSF